MKDERLKNGFRIRTQQFKHIDVVFQYIQSLGNILIFAMTFNIDKKYIFP